jgi:cobalt-zinc-cadmium efflux system membrane fusion protein
MMHKPPIQSESAPPPESTPLESTPPAPPPTPASPPPKSTPPALPPTPASPPAAEPNLAARGWAAGQFLVALTLTVGFLVYLLFNPFEPPIEPVERVKPPAEVVSIIGPGLIRVVPGSPFDEKIQVVEVRTVPLTEPMLTVSGRVVASLRPTPGKRGVAWQFDTPESLAAFTDWEKAQADIAFHEKQLEQIQALVKTRVQAQRELVQRLEKLVALGTDTPKDLTAERANLMQIEITGRQEIFQAETAVRVARREEATQVRKLHQLGLDIELLQAVGPEVDIVMADVPEGRLKQVRINQGCTARFFAVPNERFEGRVKSIAPTLSTERRTLRLLFTIDDPDDKLRPGMFAEIGLGTDQRDALLVPADAVLHIGRADYVLVADAPDTWRVTEVVVGEALRNDVEILNGLQPGMRLVGSGAILLKPLVMRALRPTSLTDGAKP